jgi:transposase
MIRMLLSAEEQLALNRLRLTKNSNVGERAHYVLLSGVDGKSVKETVIQLSRNEHTIRLWLNRYKTVGIPGLGTHKKSGRPAKKAVILVSVWKRN